MTERLIPQSLEAEESVLGALTISENAIPAASDILEPQDFFRDSHQAVYRAALDLYARNEPVDPISLTAELERNGELELAGGRVRLHELARLVPSSANVGHYAGIVREKATLRRLIETGKRIEDMGWEAQEEPDRLVEKAEGLVQGLSGRHEKHQTIYRAADVVSGFREKMANPQDYGNGVPAPWDFLQELKGGRLYVLAGYTGDGKSAVALQFMRAACEGGRKVDFASIEMSEEDLTARLMATFGIPHHECSSGRVSSLYKPSAEKALTEIEGWDFRILDDETINVPYLRRQVRVRQPEFLIVDHLHRMRWNERRDLEVAIQGITNLAREYEIPILLLSQLRRPHAEPGKPFPRPTMSMLRETSLLEQEAHAVWFIWRKRDEFNQPTTEAEFFAGKNRSGSLGFQRMAFEPASVSFQAVREP